MTLVCWIRYLKNKHNSSPFYYVSAKRSFSSPSSPFCKEELSKRCALQRDETELVVPRKNAEAVPFFFFLFFESAADSSYIREQLLARFNECVVGSHPRSRFVRVGVIVCQVRVNLWKPRWRISSLEKYEEGKVANSIRFFSSVINIGSSLKKFSWF